MDLLDDPLQHVEQSEAASVVDAAEELQLKLPGFHLTEAGIRLTLKRPLRPKPLLEIWCKGCGRSTFSPDTYLTSDYLEWPPQYYN